MLICNHDPYDGELKVSIDHGSQKSLRQTAAFDLLPGHHRVEIVLIRSKHRFPLEAILHFDSEPGEVWVISHNGKKPPWRAWADNGTTDPHFRKIAARRLKPPP